MWRCVSAAVQQAYTCTCMVPREIISRAVLPVNYVGSSSFQTSARHDTLAKRTRDRKAVLKTSIKQQTEQLDDQDEEELIMEGLSQSAGILTPTIETHNMMIAGVRYTELPIAHIQATKNNTIITVSDHKGTPIFYTSCGHQGFKNAKKGTNIAAQATGLAAGNKAKEQGIAHLRVVVKGLGIGRLPSIKGIQMSGLQVVSLTDNTMIPFFGKRPRKQRKV